MKNKFFEINQLLKPQIFKKSVTFTSEMHEGPMRFKLPQIFGYTRKCNGTIPSIQIFGIRPFFWYHSNKDMIETKNENGLPVSKS